MSKPIKIILYTTAGLVALLALSALAVFLLVDVNAYKPRLEAAASETLGMEVRIGGRLSIDFFPGLHVALTDLHIRNRGTDIASAKQARLGIDLLPLLRQEARIGEIALNHAAIFIERDRDGIFNFEKPDAAKKPLPVLELARFSIAHVSLLYIDEQAETGFEAAACNLVARRLRFPGGDSSALVKHLSLTAQLGCAEFRTRDVSAFDVRLSAVGKNGVFELKPISMHVFGGQGSANLRVDFSGAAPLYQFSYSLPQFRLEEFVKILSSKKVAEGPMSFSVNLSMHGTTANELKRTADGEISLVGENLRVHGIDLDHALARYESSQSFNLVDVGAFFFAGPWGVAVTKGYSFASIFKGSEGSSEVPVLVSEWKVERGVAQAQDVAMATNENRIVLQGRLDFVNERFEDVTVALIDANGCAKVTQTIRGPFEKPVVEKPSILATLAGPALKLLKKGRALLPGAKCEVVYTGSVAPPK